MSRDIKFRVFNKETGKMKDWDFIRKYSNLSKLIVIKHNEIMQFSGMKDSNGVDIYEGDLLGFGDFIYKVIYENGCFMVKDMKFLNPKISLIMLIINREKAKTVLQVIGNIFENPELL